MQNMRLARVIGGKEEPVVEKLSDVLGVTISGNMTLTLGNAQDLAYPQELEYTCERCGSLVKPLLIEFPKGFGGSRYIKRRCECYVQENTEIIERAKNYGRIQQIERYFSYSTLGPRFTDKTFEAFEPSAQTSLALKKAKQFVITALNAKNPEEKAKGLVFIGPTGTGKSHLAAAIYNELRKHEKTSVFITVPELLDRIRATYRTQATENEDEILAAIKKCDLLVLDDIGAERHRGEDDWATEKLFTIFDTRYRQYLPVIGTTNCQPDELEEKLGIRTMSRVREICELVPCLGDDYRRRNRVTAS